MKEKPGLLLHSCCGPCSTAVVERLAKDYALTLFFYNPNITDEEEYRTRIAAQTQYLQCYNRDCGADDTVQWKEGPYEPACFFEAVKGLESEPEGGARCEKCFALRLAKTADEALRNGFPCFGTTLSVSPHKDYRLICEIGSRLAAERGLTFLEEDFKKKGGFQRSIELSKQYGLYRQKYCGCEYSK